MILAEFRDPLSPFWSLPWIVGMVLAMGLEPHAHGAAKVAFLVFFIAFPGGRDGGNRYLVFGLGAGQAADLAVPPDRDELIAYGPLLSGNGSIWLGTAVLVRAPDADSVPGDEARLRMRRRSGL